jgi:hypothetical protein
LENTPSPLGKRGNQKGRYGKKKEKGRKKKRK